MSFRKEKKFKLSKSELQLIKFSLIKKGMKVLYPERIINSCYFDTKNLLMFHQSEEGILPRKKIRFRWYDQENEAKKEIKISSIEGRFKKTNFFGGINNLDLNLYNFYERDYGTIYPYLLIKYLREYFIYKDLRLTFDSDIQYKKINSPVERKLIDNQCVMEIKTSLETSDDYIEKIISKQSNRFSKYCRGVLLFKT